MNQKQSVKKKIVLGAGDYGCWECTLIQQTPDPGDKDTEPQPEKLWVVARSLPEIAENIPGVESAILLGKATCIADPQTPGIVTPAPEVQKAVEQAKLPVTPPGKVGIVDEVPIATCPYCGAHLPLSEFVKPEGILNELLACPTCRMLSPPTRLVKVKHV